MKKILMFVVMIMMFMVGCKSEELNFGKKLVKVNGMVDILVELDSSFEINEIIKLFKDKTSIFFSKFITFVC